MPKIQDIELSESELEMAEDMGLAEFIDYEECEDEL